MKRSVVLIILLSFGLLLNTPVSAQRLDTAVKINTGAKVSVRYSDAQAFSDGGGVWLEWNTEFELKNIGFYLYRVSNGNVELVNSSLIPGLYLQMRDASTAGGKYTYFDAQGDLNSSYYIESLNLTFLWRMCWHKVKQSAE